MKLIVGLGNEGKEYESTIHNVGFLVVEELSKRFLLGKFKRECDALVCAANIGGQKAIFAMPTTYMNRSGVAVKSLQNKYKVPAQDLVVVQDDIDLPVGTVRLRTSGSAGTHNGLKSVHEYVSGTDFVRVRVGVGKPHPGQGLADFVLSPISKKSEIWQGIALAADAVQELVEGQEFSHVQNKYSK